MRLSQLTAAWMWDAEQAGQYRGMCIGCNKACISNQVIVRPPRRRHPHRAARWATSWSPRPSSASQSTGRGSGTPGPLRSVTSMRMTLFFVLTATVIVSPGAPEPLCRILLTKSSPTSNAATSPHGYPGPSSLSTNARATRARSARPASVTVSRTARPAISAPPSRPPRPREFTRAGGRTHRDERPTRRQTSSRARSRNGHRNPIKRLRTPLPGPDSRPPCVRGHRNTAPYSATR
jgi:hypothetical protein